MASPTTDRRLGLVGNTALKAPVTVLAAGNITQSGLQTIDGVAVLATNAAGVPDRVLCTGMTDATKNGIFDVSTAAWTRAKDADGNYDFTTGTTVYVYSGSVYGGTYWKLDTSGAITIGTSSLAWSRALASALSTLTFVQAGTGAASRPAQDKMRELVTPEDFYLAADADSGGMIQRALNTIGVTSRGVRFNPATTYSVSTTMTVTGKSSFRLHGAGQITQTAANKPIFTLTTCSDFQVDGLQLYGLGTDFTPLADGCLGDGIKVDGCFDFAIHHSTFKNFGYTGVRAVNACFNFQITDNRFYGTNGITTPISNGDNYQFGVIVQSGTNLLSPCYNFEISRNRISNTAFGVRCEPGSLGYECHQNVIYDIKGQHGFYLNGSVFSVNGNVLRNIPKVGIKLQSFQVNGIAYTQGISDATANANTINTCETGISLEKTGSLAPDADSVTICGNTMKGVTTAGYGINLQDCSAGLLVDSNNISGGAHGILATVITAGSGCNGRITNNVIRDTQWAAISGYSYQTLAVTNNTAVRPCLAAGAADAQKSAFYVSAPSTSHRVKVSDNTLVTDTSTGVVNGLFVGTVDLDRGPNDFEAKPISAASGTLRKQFGADYVLTAALTTLGPITASQSLSKSVTVTGAVLGDIVLWKSFNQDLVGCSLDCEVTAADTVKVVITNGTTSSQTPSNGSLRLGVARFGI